MNPLLEKYDDYMRLNGFAIKYELSDGTCIEVTYKEENFLHLLGLHKLQDIQLIQFWTARNNKTVKLKDVIRKIRNEDFTDSDVRASCFFKDIEYRYNNFTYDNLTTLNYTDVIINFNAKLIHSVLKGDYILFEERPTGEYNHMSVALDKNTGNRYVESFFHEQGNKYLNGQRVLPIKKFVLLDDKGNEFLSDTF